MQIDNVMLHIASNSPHNKDCEAWRRLLKILATSAALSKSDSSEYPETADVTSLISFCDGNECLLYFRNG